MAADLNLPSTTQSDGAYAQSEKDNQLELAKLSGNFSNLVAGVMRFNSSKFQAWSGSAWADAAVTYAINVASVGGLTPGNASGNLPISNGTVNTNLNADKLDGADAGTGINQVLLLDGAGQAPSSILPASGVGAGTYKSVTVDTKGRVVSGTNPTTLSGFGITDAAALNGSTSQLFSVAAATGRNNVPRADQIQRGALTNITAAGTDTYTGTLTPTLDAYSSVLAPLLIHNGGGTNTSTAPTMNVDTLGALTMCNVDFTALRPGDFVTGCRYLCSIYWTGLLSTSRLLVLNVKTRPSYGKQALWIPASAMTPRSGSGCAALATVATATIDVKTLDFDANSAEYAQFELTMPKSWDEGNVTFQAVWSHAATATNFGVVWSINAGAISDNEALAVSMASGNTVVDTGGTTDRLYISPESTAFAVGGSPVAGDHVVCWVSRAASNGSDTLSIDARLHGVVLFVTTDTETDA